MKIGTFNLRDLFDEGHCFPFYGEEVTYTADFVKRRVTWIVAMIRKADPDILFLQEVASASVLARIVSEMELGYTVFSGEPDQRGIANAVLYRLSNCACSSMPAEGPLPVFMEGDEDLYGKRIADITRRGFVKLETLYHERPLTLIGVHVKASFGIEGRYTDGKRVHATTQLDAADNFIRSAIVRLSQARKLREIADTLFLRDGDDAQVVIIGDFNALEYSEVLRIIRGELGETPASLSDACDMVPECKRFSHIKHGKRRLIDHIMVSRGIQKSVRSVKIFNRKLRDQTTTTAATLAVESDHAPIVMELI